MAVLILAAVIRIGYCIGRGTLGHSPEAGYREYVIAGQRLITRGTLVSPLIVEDVSSAPSSLLPPAYAGLVAGAYAAFGVESCAATLVLQFLNILATSAAAAGVSLIAARESGARAAWIAGVAAAINPTLIGFVDYVWETSLFGLGVVVSLRLSQRLAEASSTWLPAFLFGLWLGVLALLNPALTIAYPLLVLRPLGKSPRCGRALVRGATAAVCGWLVAVAPWTIRNYAQFGELIYIRGGFMHELWLGVCPEADTDGASVFKSRFPLLNQEAQRRVVEIGEAAYIRECGERAHAAIKADPSRFARLVTLRSADYWLGTVFTHAGPGEGGLPHSRSRRAVALFLSIEVAIALIGLLVLRGRRAVLGWLLGIVFLFSLVYCLTHVELRYRAASEPLMAVMVGIVAGGGIRAASRPHEAPS